jgi:hypothetical protein
VASLACHGCLGRPEDQEVARYDAAVGTWVVEVGHWGRPSREGAGRDLEGVVGGFESVEEGLESGAEGYLRVGFEEGHAGREPHHRIRVGFLDVSVDAVMHFAHVVLFAASLVRDQPFAAVFADLVVAAVAFAALSAPFS